MLGGKRRGKKEAWGWADARIFFLYICGIFKE